MSKIEVDAITEQSGSTLTAGGGAGKTVVVDATTVTLGRCGGTVALASGATQSGFGRTGTVDWITTPKTATFTAVSGEGYFANTTGGTFTMNLPAGVAGAIVSVADYAATWQTSNVTVTPNGTDKIGSVNQNAILDTQGQSVTFVYVDSTQGWINTMDSTSNVRAGFTYIAASVSGACNTLTTVDTDYKLATFKGPGNFCVSSLGNSPCNSVSYIVVAGGGGGGGDSGAGGGAGGFREGYVPGSYTASPLAAGALPVSVTSYPIVIGGGGAGNNAPVWDNGIPGSVSSFSTITSTGGGGGGTGAGLTPYMNGLPGGSGGGGSRTAGHSIGTGNTPPVSPPQGNDGGLGGAPSNGGGGGGGATVVGTGTPGSDNGGPGGTGAATSIIGSSTFFAGGGGGAAGSPTIPAGGTGGTGGGGSGAARLVASVVGTINTGGGGGGGSSNGPAAGSQGGSGIVYIRYKFQ